MIKLKKLYSNPEIFDPISFDYGINIIMGEKSNNSNKKIGVGKSVCIEFINFCLLKKFHESRLSFIPRSSINMDAKIRLDLQLNDKNITIERALKSPDQIIIFVNNEEIFFDSLDDASNYLGDLYFRSFPPKHDRLSFRNLLQPIIRDERSEFKDLILCHDTKRTIPADFSPHLFFLDIELSLYKEIKGLNEDIKKKRSYVSETKKLVTRNNEFKIQDAKAHLNELESEVKKLDSSIENLRNNDSFELIQEDLIKLESELEKIRDKQQAIKYEIKQIDSLPQPENISENEISIVFNQFKKGLGDMVEKSLDDLKSFKNKIDGFRNTIVNERLDNLKTELSALNSRARKLDEKHSEKLSLIDHGEVLKDLRTSISIFNQKHSELSNLRSLLERYDSAEREKKILNARKTKLLADLDEELYNQHNLLKSFEETILNIHERIMGNREAHFEIGTTKNKNIVEFLMRTDDDGSHSTERMKVFVYDIALLINKYTKKRHPGFLIHDNIFEDDDSLEKSLNFLYEYNEKSPNEFQYIVTLNRDLVESIHEKNLLFNIDNFKRATFTKTHRFLKLKYTEK